jgi:FlaA1/EpsC-like NDP-sugar epimerase
MILSAVEGESRPNDMNQLFLKRLILAAFDILLACVAYVMAFELRFGFDLRPEIISTIAETICVVALAQLIAFILFGLYRKIWRYADIPEFLTVGKAVALGAILAMGSIFIYNRLENVPRSVFVIYGFVLIVIIVGSRITYQFFARTGLQRSGSGPNTLIVGAGNAGTRLLRTVLSDPRINFSIVGLVDDDNLKKGRTILGYQVLGGIDDIERIAESKEVEQILVAIPSATGPEMLRIMEHCQRTGARVMTIPTLKELINGGRSIHDLRPVKIEDLLGRQQVELDPEPIVELVAGKRIVVTGAGGSIGSELCRQIAPFEPAELILIDRSEFFLYSIENELRAFFPNLNHSACLADVCDRAKIEAILQDKKPYIVLHAAAYKHVPILESNPRAAILNNVGGTVVTAESAVKFGVKKFVFISTDKAVNPVSVLGASKRAAEIACLALQKSADETGFSIVRFGNVLGSTGSVIARFEEQIKNGGPVTVTHEEVERYFMLAAEAAKLVLLSAAIADRGEIFVLDMGEPVKIIDLARVMIRLQGRIPGKDIEIMITGLRPGEKIREELLAGNEIILPTFHSKILRVKPAEPPPGLEAAISELLSEARADNSRLSNNLQRVVPEYKPKTYS